MQNRRTDAVIADMMDAAYGNEQCGRKHHIMRQALHGLVRLAKAEQLMEMREDTDRAVGHAGGAERRRKTRALIRKIDNDVRAGRQRLAFEQQTGREED